jgi:fluoroacetyl-CoA thioesterase
MAPIVGSSANRRVTIDEARAISFMGPDMRVYATPWMLHDVEYACRDLLLTMLDPGQDTVGTFVEMHHLGAAKIGQTVDIEVKVETVNGRRVRLDAVVSLDGRAIGNVKHERAIVAVDELRRRLRGA